MIERWSFLFPWDAHMVTPIGGWKSLEVERLAIPHPVRIRSRDTFLGDDGRDSPAAAERFSTVFSLRYLSRSDSILSRGHLPTAPLLHGIRFDRSTHGGPYLGVPVRRDLHPHQRTQRSPSVGGAGSGATLKRWASNALSYAAQVLATLYDPLKADMPPRQDTDSSREHSRVRNASQEIDRLDR
eukprot:scaffold545_cov372-Pavlova_lutheri.AAC.11